LRTLTYEEIVRLRLEENRSYAEIGKKANISKQRVQVIVKKYSKGDPIDISAPKIKPPRNTICQVSKKRCYIKWHSDQLDLYCFGCKIYHQKLKKKGV